MDMINRKEKEMKKMRFILAMGLSLAFMASFMLSASALTVTNSTKKYATVLGYDYEYDCQAYCDSSNAWAYTNVGCTDGVRPTGYMGAYARLYSSSGTLVASGPWMYTDSPAGGISVPSSYYSTSGTFYSKGQVQIYNGDGYTTYTTTASPNVQRASMLSPTPYGINSKGLTYGSDFFTEATSEGPDLIRAIGINAVEGYVYAEDINQGPQTLSEVLAYIEAGYTNRIIPVYSLDGETIVDYFLIEAVSPSCS